MRSTRAHDADEGTSPRARRRLLGVALMAVPALSMVGLFLTGIGLLALDLAGGAAADTGTVILFASFAITDFWGGALLAIAARADVRTTAISWTIGRAILLIVLLLVTGMRPWVVIIQIAIAGVAAFIGARLADRHRDILADRLRARIESTRPAASTTPSRR